MADIKNLKALFYYRWNVPVLAEFHGSSGLRFVVLVSRLGVSKDSLSTSLLSLTEQELVRKNPGYGHPLRAEYILTDRGARIAEVCSKLTRHAEGETVCAKKWHSPVLLGLLQGQSRFNELKTTLDITPRALTIALRSLEEGNLIKRRIDGGYPPTSSYHLTARGKSVGRCIVAIADALG